MIERKRPEGWPSRGRARLGVIVPMSNTNLEPDMMLLRPEGVSLHFARAGGYDLNRVPDSDQMRRFAEASLDAVLALLLPARPDVLLYGCTSATLAKGPDFDRAFAAKLSERAGAPAVTAAGALVEALKDLGLGRVGFCSPYTEALNREAAGFLTEAGIEVVEQAYVGEDLGNYGQSALEPAAVFDLGRRADHPRAEAVVLSCTDMRAVEIIEQLEAATGKPVVTSNQALAYAAMKRLPFETDLSQLPGRLFARPVEAV